MGAYLKFMPLALLFAMFVVLPQTASPWGVITHLTILDDIIKDPRLDPEIRRILQENIDYAKGGVNGPDMYYAWVTSRFADMAHYCNPGDLARTMLKLAQAENDKKEREKQLAYVYGWMIHVASDAVGHAWVNERVGSEYDRSNKSAVKAHIALEADVDRKNLIDHSGDPLCVEMCSEIGCWSMCAYSYVTEMSVPHSLLEKAYSSLYGPCNAMGPVGGAISETLLQGFLNSRLQAGPNDSETYNRANTEGMRQAYSDSNLKSIDTLNTAGANLPNYDTDTGLLPGDELYKGHIKCDNYGKLKDCTGISRPGPGGDHPDDLASVGAEDMSRSALSVDSILRVGVKKGLDWVLWLDALRRATFSYQALPEEVPPEVRIQKLKEVIDLYNGLNEPDDWRGFSENNAQFFQDLQEAADVAVLENGYWEPMSSLLENWNEPVKAEGVTVSPLDLAKQTVLIIPSGGLYGLERSAFLSGVLDNYVKDGGTLIVFAQQHGYEFGVLPVPQEPDGTYRRVTGYGWAEDHSCFRSAAFIDTWHQMLAALTRATPDVNVDGYFTEYPSNSTILLRRTANGQPAMLMYEYGLGRVIVTSMYSDFASQHNQASSEEKALVRDMITWAKSPQSLPEVRPGQAMTLEINVTNHAKRDASAVKLNFFDPARSTLLGEQTLDLPIPAGSSSSIQVTFSTSQNGPTGIYHVDYVLLDAQGLTVQPEAETDSGRFVVSNPPKDPYRSPDFSFSVQSDSEHYLRGSSVRFTFNLWNNTGKDRQITTWFILPHNRRREENTLTVPAMGRNSFTYVLEPVINTDRVWAYFRDENGRNVGFAAKGIWVVVPEASLKVQVDKARYEKGESVVVSGSVANKVVLGWPAEARITVIDAQKRVVFEDSRSLVLAGSGSTELTSSFQIPQAAQPGTYSVSLEAWHEGNRVSFSSTRFDVPVTRVSVKPNLPSVYNSGINAIPFTLTNQGPINVRSGILEIALTEPGGNLVWSESLPFSLAMGEKKTLPVPVVFPPLKLGTYVLSYTQSDETRTGSPTTVKITNNTVPIMSALLDKTSYRARDTALLTVKLINNGQFGLSDVPVTVSLLGTSQTETRYVSLPPGESSQIVFPVSIPPEIPSGQHKIEVKAFLSPQAVLTRGESFNLPESRLVVDYSGPTTLAAGGALKLTIQNIGGVDTAYNAESITLTTAEGLKLWEENGVGQILAGESKGLTEILISDQMAGGLATVRVRVRDDATQNIVLFSRSFPIQGLTAGLETRTSQDVYLVNDSAAGLTTLTNGALGLENGSIKVAVSRVAPTSVLGFRVHYPMSSYNKWITTPQAVALAGDGRLLVAEGEKDRLWERSPSGQTNWTEIWNGFNEPRGIAVSAEGTVYVADAEDRRVLKFEGWSWADEFGGGFQFLEPSGAALGLDGNVYIVDSGLHQVLKFDPQGNLVAQWGEYGQAQGQMINPRAIAVSQDGRIWVADTGNHRVQVLDSQGSFNFLFGGQGIEEGRFLNPQGVALGPDGSIYVADTGNNRIQVFDGDGNFIFAWGEQGKAEGQLSSPRGLALGPDGTVYVADTLNSRIQAFDQTGNYLFSWDIGYCEPTCGACQEIYPGYCDYLWGYCHEKELFYCNEEDYWSSWFQWGSAMAVSPEGTLYAFNPYRHVIQELDVSYGELWILREWGEAGSAEGQLQSPHGMALGPDGSIYVADTGNSRVQHFDKDGVFMGSWGTEGEGQGQFRSPEGIAVSWDGKVCVADTGNHRVQIFDPDGGFVAAWGREGQAPGEFSFPKGIAVGPVGYVYVTDTGNNRVQRFDLEGRFLGEFGTPASGSGELSSPTGIAVGTLGYVYVIDSGNNRVVRFDRDGNFQEEWTEHECNYGDADYCTQVFPELNSIASGPDGTVYLADWEKFYISLNQDEGAEKIFEAEHAVSLSPGESRDFTDLTGPLTKPGKYLLEATAKNSLAQVLARKTHPFYVAEQNIILNFEPERKLYRPGELIRISGLIENRAPAAAGGLKLYLFAENSAGERVDLIFQTLDLPAGGSLPISASMTAGQEGILLLTGLVVRQDTTLSEVLDRLEVENPRVYQTLDVPQLVGNDPFPIRIHLRNPGKLPVSLGLEIKEEGGLVILGQEFHLEGGEERVLETLHQIIKDTDLSFFFSGDLSVSETRRVSYGLGAQIQLAPQPLYSKGPVAIDVMLTNTGRLDEMVTVSYQVSPGGIESVRTYTLPAGGTTHDALYFILPEGSYEIRASCLHPTALAQGFFQVRGENRVGLTLIPGEGTGGAVPITAQVSNLGSNEIGLSVLAEVTDESGWAAWNGQEGLAALIPGASGSVSFQIPAATLPAGAYTSRVSVFSNSGEPLASAEAVFTVKAPLIQVIRAPSYETFQPGEEAVFNFRLRNSGDQGSSFQLKFKAEEFADFSEQGWLGAGEEKEVVFQALLPEDLNEKDWFGIWELDEPKPGEKGTIRYHVAGLSLTVVPSLDKTSYREGETARLTLEIQTSTPSLVPFAAQVKYAGFEEQRSFTLAGSQSLIFDIPLPKITGEKLFFGIYHASGRSIHLNSLHIYKAGDLLNLATDKQTYRPGDAVEVRAEGEANGNMTLAGPGGYTESFAFSGFASRSFVLPSTMTAGTYEVLAQLRTVDSQLITASRKFDVAGIQVRVKEAVLDKARYNSSDTMRLSLLMESSEPLSAVIRTWVMDPQGEYTQVGDSGVTLTDTEPVVAGLSVPLSATMLGLHRLAYGIYLGDLLLCSGAEAFDVGKAVLLGVRTDSTEYPSHMERVQVQASLLGEGEGALEVLLDEVSQAVLPVSLHGGRGSLSFTIPSMSPGKHKVKALLRMEGLTSAKETSLVYGTGLPDLSVELRGSLESGHPLQASFSMEVRNQGKGNSPATTLALYEEPGASVLHTFDVAPLAPGQIQTFSYGTQVTGPPGPRTFLLKADPQAQVPEFQKENNEARLTLTVPEVWLETSTDKETYHAGETVHIISKLLNNGALALEGLSLQTLVRDPAGAEVFSETTAFHLEAASQLNLDVQWPIPSGLSWGTYVLEQQVVGKSLVSKKTIALTQGEKGFTLSTDSPPRRVEAGEAASWVLAVNPSAGFEGDVSLSVSGLPPNCASVLLPNPVQLSGGIGAQVALKVITTSQSPPGDYSVTITAFSGLSQESLQVALEIVDFSLSIVPVVQSIKQLDKAAFSIRTDPLGAFEGPVSFSLSGLPKGVRAELSVAEAAPGEEVALEIFTSKWVLPGDYNFEVISRGRAASHSVRGRLSVEANPALAPRLLTSCSRDQRGRSIIKSFTPEGDWLRDFIASSKGGAVSLASGDLDGDGLDELVVGTTRAGIFSPARIRVLGRDGRVLSEVPTEHRGWLHPLTVAVGDLDGDWKEEIVVGISSQEEPREEPEGEAWLCPLRGEGVVKVYKLLGGRLVETGLKFVPFPEPWSWMAPNVAVGDVDGDGRPELITAPGPTAMAPALVRIFQVETKEPMHWEIGSLKAEWEVDFTPSHGPWVGYGANVSAVDLNCDGRDEIIVGAPPSPRALAEVAVIPPEAEGEVEHLFLAFPEGRGVYVSGGNTDGDPCGEIIVGQGPGPKAGAKVRIFKGDATSVREFQAECQPVHLGVRTAVGALGD